MEKILWFDTETTGLNAAKCGIHQLSGLIEINGEIVEEFDIKMNPQPCEVQPRALEVSGKTLEDLEAYPPMHEGYQKFKEILGRYVNHWDKKDKFIVGGYNVPFDIEFLSRFFKRMGDDYLFAYLHGGKRIDPLSIVGYMQWAGLLPQTINGKLATISESLGISARNAHDALADVHMTRKVAYKLRQLMLNGPEETRPGGIVPMEDREETLHIDPGSALKYMKGPNDEF